MSHTVKRGSNSKQLITFGKIRHTKTWITFRKMSHTVKNGSHCENKLTFGTMGHSVKNGYV